MSGDDLVANREQIAHDVLAHLSQQPDTIIVGPEASEYWATDESVNELIVLVTTLCNRSTRVYFLLPDADAVQQMFPQYIMVYSQLSWI